MLELSEHFRPEHGMDLNGKAVEEFRKYPEDDYIQRRVERTYYLKHKNETVDFSRNRVNKFNHANLTIMEALIKLISLIDESDPDSDLPNIVHASQIAERILASHQGQEWFHLTGLVHDLGKVMAH